MRRSLGTLACTLPMALTLACDGDQPAPAREAATPPAAPPVVEIVANDYAYTAPDTIPGGFVTLRVRDEGKELHHVTLFKLGEGKTVSDLMTAMAAGGPIPWAQEYGGPNTPVPGAVSEATVELEPGSYAMVCLIPSADGMPHMAKGMVKAITVVAPPAPATAPGADVVVKLVDYDFQLSVPLTAGHHVLKFEVDATQPHEAVIVKLAPGKTAADVAAWVEKMVGPPPGMPIGGLTTLAPGMVNYVPVDLEPGEYGFLCFVPDHGDGKPHVAHGMAKQIKVA